VTLLYVHALTVVDAGGRRLIDQLSLHLDGGQVLGLTGGAKTGKSLLCDILAGARPGGVEIASGRILLGDRDLVIEHDEPDGAIADWRPGDSSGNTRVAICRDASVFCDIDRPANAGFIVIDRAPTVLAEMCDEIAVLCAGRLIERGPASDIIQAPRHPYTRALLDGCETQGNRGLKENSCPFRLRCQHGTAACDRTSATLQLISADRATACLRWRDLWPAN
jgi:ABC-type dipeptide/oligopeptide/nickel transport system ATPase component